MPAASDYELLETIGQGSFGKVCKIRRKVDGKMLVWKVINYSHMTAVEKQRLSDEVMILKDLRSPFIVQYHEHVHDRANKRLYIVMEHCPRGDLRQLIKECRRDGLHVDERFIWRLLAQLMVALKECQSRPRPILHRDIKPANVLLDAERNVKLCDFGLAKELKSHYDFAATNVGTPYYMSPELVNRQLYDSKADVWSVGCLLYEVAALRPPFDATSHPSLMAKINAGRFCRIPERYSDALFNVIRAMLERDPTRRPGFDQLEKEATLGPFLREARAVAHEYNNNRKHHERLAALRVREEEVARREAELDKRERSMEERERRLKAAMREHEARLSSPLPPPPCPCSCPLSPPPSTPLAPRASCGSSGGSIGSLRQRRYFDPRESPNEDMMSIDENEGDSPNTTVSTTVTDDESHAHSDCSRPSLAADGLTHRYPLKPRDHNLPLPSKPSSSSSPRPPSPSCSNRRPLRRCPDPSLPHTSPLSDQENRRPNAPLPPSRPSYSPSSARPPSPCAPHRAPSSPSPRVSSLLATNAARRVPLFHSPPAYHMPSR